MKDPSELPREKLDSFVRTIQHLLYLEERDTEDGVEEFWDPHKERDEQMLDAIAAFMREMGLAPKDKK